MVPTFDVLMWPALVAMKELGGSATHDELLEKVIELEHIPEAVQNVMHTERKTKVSYNLAWAKTYLGKVVPSKTPPTVSGPSPKKARL
jgi:restriction system protein